MRAQVGIIIFIVAGIAALGQSKRAYLHFGNNGRNFVYIDYNKKSKYYDLVANFKLNASQRRDYKAQVNNLKAQSNGVLSKKPLGDLPLNLCLLKDYQNESFIYYPADQANNYRIAFNDTTCIEYGRSVTASQIISVKKTNGHTYTITRKVAGNKLNTIVIHMVEVDANKKIAVVEGAATGAKYTMMTPAVNVRNFELIVNPCKNSKCPEYPFNPKPKITGLIESL
jgi:hypothetical protein